MGQRRDIGMSWKKRWAEIMRLKAKHGKDRSLIRTFPDLSVEKRTAPTGDLRPPGGSLSREQVVHMMGKGWKVSLTTHGYKVIQQ